MVTDTNITSSGSLLDISDRSAKKALNLDRSDQKFKFVCVDDEIIFSKLIQIAPETSLQLVLFEIPLLWNLPFYLFYALTFSQWELLILNSVCCFALGLLCINSLNKSQRPCKSKTTYYVLFTIALIGLIGLMWYSYGWFFSWQIQQFTFFK